jgi:hypothetical protein
MVLSSGSQGWARHACGFRNRPAIRLPRGWVSENMDDRMRNSDREHQSVFYDSIMLADHAVHARIGLLGIPARKCG